MAYRDFVTKWNSEEDLLGQQALFERFLSLHTNGIVPVEAMAFLLGKMPENPFFSVQLLRELQTLASRGSYTAADAIRPSFAVPGSYKKTDNGGCAPEECDTLVGDFVQEISSFGTNNPLFYGAYLIADLCSFRPFPYANLETALLSFDHYLMSHKMAPLFFPNEQRQRFLEAVDAYTESESLAPLRSLLQEAAEITEKFLF